MRKLNWDLKKIGTQNKDGSIATQHDRSRILSLIANQLHEDGYRQMRAKSLKLKHVEHLVARWTRETLNVGTIKNRMAALRWWAEKVKLGFVIANSNDKYGIENRVFAVNESKAKNLTAEKLHLVSDKYTKISLELQRAFGLRREEAIKFQPSYADQGDKLVLKGSWTKGGKPREIPIRTQHQKDLLQRAHQFAGKASLINPSKNYIQQLKTYENNCSKAGLDRNHGLRHAYAQERYKELTGRDAPAASGLTSAQLSGEEKALDKEARLTISSELGHEREAITVVYLGR